MNTPMPPQISVSGSSSGPATFFNAKVVNTSGAPAILSGTSTLSGVVGFTGGPITFSGPATASNGTAVNVSSGQTVTFQQLIVSPTGSTFVKTGPGTLVLDSANFNGPIVLQAGTIIVKGNNSNTYFTVGTAVLGGSTTMKGITLDPGAIIKPGYSPGLMSAATGLWNGGATFEWEINSATGAPGGDPGWDTFNFSGGLVLAATPAEPLVIALKTLNSTNGPGPMTSFNHTAS